MQKKLVIVGDRAVGKHCLAMAYKQGSHVLYIPTIDEDHVSDDEVDRHMIEFDLLDTHGQEDHEVMRSFCYLGASVILMCFSFDNPDSLSNILERWLPEVKLLCPNVPIVLVANKKDLRDDPNLLPIHDNLIQQVATELGAYASMKCSAKTGEGIYEVFEAAARAALEKKVPNEKKSSCSVL